MQITMKSGFSGKTNTLEIDVTHKQLEDWRAGKGLIQDVMPNLTPDEREFLMTGATANEWDEMIGSGEEE